MKQIVAYIARRGAELGWLWCRVNFGGWVEVETSRLLEQTLL